MKVAITGVSGYLGRLIVSVLGADPAVNSILGLDIVSPNIDSPKFSFQYADVRSANFKELLQGIDVVYHLAFIVEPPKRMSITTIDEINIDGSKRLFEGASAAGVSKLIYSSSVAAYGAHSDNADGLTEDSPLRPNEDWYYSRAKGRIEFYLNEFEKMHPEIIVIRFRPSIFLGPTINNSFRTFFSNRWILCLKDNIKLDLCWDQDIAEAFRLALHYNRSDIFNLTGGDPVTTEEIGAVLGKKVLHLNHKFVTVSLKIAHFLGMLSKPSLEWITVGLRGPITVSAQKAQERLSWKPRFSTKEALLEYYRQCNLLQG